MSVNQNEKRQRPSRISRHPQSQTIWAAQFVPPNYRSRWKRLDGSGLSFLQISALLYKAMQMRRGLRDPAAVPVARIKWERDTVFLWGVQTRRKCGELCWEASADGAWRLNSYIWALLPTGLVLRLLMFPSCSDSGALQPSLGSLVRENKDYCTHFQFPTNCLKWIINGALTKRNST